MSENVLYKVEDRIATITLNKPEILNAFDLEMLLEIHERAHEAEADDEVAVVIIKGAGRAFCSGADLKYRGRALVENPEGYNYWRRRTPGVSPFWILNKATIAQIQGFAVGGGMVMAVMSDITIAAEGTKIGYPMVRVGSLVGHRHPYNWLVGPKKARELIFTGRLIDADEALRIGLVNHVVPADGLEQEVMRMAADIAAIETSNPGFVRANKVAINSVNPELTKYALPYWAEGLQAMNEYQASAVKTTTEFFRNIDERGVDEGLERMHGGFSGRD